MLWYLVLKPTYLVGGAVPPQVRASMWVNIYIDISSTYLLDTLSDHPVHPTAARGGSSARKVMADQAATFVRGPIPMDDADARVGMVIGGVN
ncbi:hypothetical protein F4604DRAFT_1735714 [Suillus subluteus]|nr:hypothetical protein F4604DRAFT_1735714 [Suillus subluteus]